MICTMCGKQLDDNASYCFYCGQMFSNPITTDADKTSVSDPALEAVLLSGQEVPQQEEAVDSDASEPKKKFSSSTAPKGAYIPYDQKQALARENSQSADSKRQISLLQYLFAMFGAIGMIFSLFLPTITTGTFRYTETYSWMKIQTEMNRPWAWIIFIASIVAFFIALFDKMWSKIPYFIYSLGVTAFCLISLADLGETTKSLRHYDGIHKYAKNIGYNITVISTIVVLVAGLLALKQFIDGRKR
ncbi:MAG: zinc ribbon domain-containing protein [Clostridiales bacterium]|nr:zinc ribbon domain-containing protein [Clostridiales bacterium]